MVGRIFDARLMPVNSGKDFLDANRMFREGDIDSAISTYEDAIKNDPDFYVYCENLALSLERTGRLDRALEMYRRALDLCPDLVFSADALRRLSVLRGNEEFSGSFFDAKKIGSSRIARLPCQERALKQEYLDKRLYMDEDNFILYRIIGNDLYPRHALGQSRKNLDFILNNEPRLDGCEKRWVVNRIVDHEEEEKIIDLLERFDQSYVVIPFEIEEYRKIPWDMSVFPRSDFFLSNDFRHLSHEAKARAVTAVYRLKNNYVMNNNGARNFAIQDGRRHAKWIFPCDGNCFFTKSAWDQIRIGILSECHMKYFVIPMTRLSNNNDLFRVDFIPDAIEEPQIAFRKDAVELFNEDFCYGRRPKVEIFWRLGVPGRWDSWGDEPWDQPRLPVSSEAYQFSIVGWVARLFCGTQAAGQNESGSKYRWKARQGAILETIDRIEREISAESDSDVSLPSEFLLN